MMKFLPGGAFTPIFYARIVSQPVSGTIRFLLVFLLMISATLAIHDGILVQPRIEFINKWSQDNLRNIPEIEVRKGVLVRPEETFILEIDNKTAVLAIEPEPAKQARILAEYRNLVMLPRDQFIFQQSGSGAVPEIKRRDFDRSKDWKISPNESGFSLEFENKRVFFTPENLRKWFRAASMLVFPAFFAVLFLVNCLTRPLQILFFTLIGLTANAILRTRATYKQIFNVCSYAFVPPAVLMTVLEVLRLNLPGEWFLFSAIYALYIFLGLQAAKPPKNP